MQEQLPIELSAGANAEVVERQAAAMAARSMFFIELDANISCAAHTFSAISNFRDARRMPLPSAQEKLRQPRNPRDHSAATNSDLYRGYRAGQVPRGAGERNREQSTKRGSFGSEISEL